MNQQPSQDRYPTTQPEEKRLTQVDDYLDYHQTLRGPAPPRAVFADIELIAATYPLRLFAMRSTYPLETVLSPGYFADLSDCHLRRLDRIELVADFHGEGTFATLVVDAVNKSGSDVRVSLLAKYDRLA